MPLPGLQPHVVIGLKRIPVEPVGQRAFGKRKRHGVGAVRRLLGMDGVFVVDRRVGGHDCVACLDHVLAGLHQHAVFILLHVIDRGLGVEAAAGLLNGGGKPGEILERMERRLVGIAQRGCVFLSA